MIALSLILALGLGTDAPPPTEAPAAPPAKVKLLVLDVKAADLEKSQIAALTDVVAARAARFGQADVVSSSDVRELLALEAQKIESGCDDGDSCLAEIAGAMSADWVLATRAGKIGNRFVITMQLYDAKQGAVAARDTAEAYSIDELPTKLSEMADAVLTLGLGPAQTSSASVVVAAAAQVPAEAAAPSPLHLGLQIGGGVAIVAGLVAGGVGLVPFVLYNQAKGDLQKKTRDFDGSGDQLSAAAKVHDEAIGYRDAYNGLGRFAALGGLVLVVGGGAALAAGFLLPPPDEQQASGGAP